MGYTYSDQWDARSELYHNAELYIQQILIVTILIVEINFPSPYICVSVLLYILCIQQSVVILQSVVL